MTETMIVHQMLRLPHTGLRVPDLSFSIGRYRPAGGEESVQFTANLWRLDQLVGTVENDGRGGMTFFRPSNRAVFDDEHLAAYAQRCRTEEGGEVSPEWLLEMLVSEHQWTWSVRDAQVKGRLALRKMGFLMATETERAGDWPPTPLAEWADSKVPTRESHWSRLKFVVLLKMPPGPHAWWQAWHGGRWRDVTDRPKDVDPKLYG